jgi:hypothetical protein
MQVFAKGLRAGSAGAMVALATLSREPGGNPGLTRNGMGSRSSDDLAEPESEYSLGGKDIRTLLSR